MNCQFCDRPMTKRKDPEDRWWWECHTCKARIPADDLHAVKIERLLEAWKPTSMD